MQQPGWWRARRGGATSESTAPDLRLRDDAQSPDDADENQRSDERQDRRANIPGKPADGDARKAHEHLAVCTRKQRPPQSVWQR